MKPDDRGKTVFPAWGSITCEFQSESDNIKKGNSADVWSILDYKTSVLNNFLLPFRWGSHPWLKCSMNCELKKSSDFWRHTTLLLCASSKAALCTPIAHAAFCQSTSYVTPSCSTSSSFERMCLLRRFFFLSPSSSLLFLFSFPSSPSLCRDDFFLSFFSLPSASSVFSLCFRCLCLVFDLSPP